MVSLEYPPMASYKHAVRYRHFPQKKHQSSRFDNHLAVDSNALGLQVGYLVVNFG